MTAVEGSGGLSPVELASGIVFGTVDEPPPLPRPLPGDTALAALERVCLRALERPPCLVSFSGGIDSSLVLAAATRVARREGLPLPVPATNRFPRARNTQESEWQELVVSRLALEDWTRLEFTDELDAVGPIATGALRRHGLLWPFNSHFHIPLLQAAAGGSLLTGIGGDELFGVPRWARAFEVLGGRIRPSRRDALRVALLASPLALRRQVLVRRSPPGFPWLRPEANQELAGLWAASEAAEPVRLSARVRRIQAGRPLRVGLRSLALLAEDADAALIHPLATPEVGVAVARDAPWRGFESRASAVRALFGELLPPGLVSRSTKAFFEGAFWGAHSRAAAAEWQGEGADLSVVDPARLRDEWSEAEPDGHSYLLLQAAVVARHREGMKNGRLARRLVVSAGVSP